PADLGAARLSVRPRLAARQAAVADDGPDDAHRHRPDDERRDLRAGDDRRLPGLAGRRGHRRDVAVPAVATGPARRGRSARPLEPARYRVRRPAWTVVHGLDEWVVRRAALLRGWDLGERLQFEGDRDRQSSALLRRSPDGNLSYEGSRAARELISLFPGLWWLWPIGMFPGVGRLAAAILRQRV